MSWTRRWGCDDIMMMIWLIGSGANIRWFNIIKSELTASFPCFPLCFAFPFWSFPSPLCCFPFCRIQLQKTTSAVWKTLDNTLVLPIPSCFSLDATSSPSIPTPNAMQLLFITHHEHAVHVMKKKQGLEVADVLPSSNFWKKRNMDFCFERMNTVLWLRFCSLQTQ